MTHDKSNRINRSLWPEVPFINGFHHTPMPVLKGTQARRIVKLNIPKDVPPETL